MKKIFINLLNFNGQSDTMECLSSLNEVVIDNFLLKVLVIDNGSEEKFNINRDKTKKIDVEVVASNENLGFSGGHNLGIRYALKEGADYIIILNNDVFVDKHLIVELLNSSEEKTVGIISPKIYFAKGYEFHKERYTKNELGNVIWFAGGKIDWENVIASHTGVDEVDQGQYEKNKKIQFATGCCMMIKKDVFEKIGMFDEKYFLYFEDSDFSIRAVTAGFEILYSPKAKLWHKNAGSTGGSGSKLQDYFTTRNRMVFGMKYASVRARVALIKESVRFLLNGRPEQKKGVQDFYLSRFGKGNYLK